MRDLVPRIRFFHATKPSKTRWPGNSGSDDEEIVIRNCARRIHRRAGIPSLPLPTAAINRCERRASFNHDSREELMIRSLLAAVSVSPLMLLAAAGFAAAQ